MGIDLRALAISILLAAALYFTYGQFVLEWMTVLPIVLALVLFALPTPKWFLRSREILSLLTVIGFLIVAAISLLPPEGSGLRSMIVDVGDPSSLPAMRVLFGLAGLTAVALYFVCRRAPKFSPFVFGLLLAFMIGAYTLIMSASPRAQIDVWTVHEEGATAFIAGENPYTHVYTNIYPEELRPALTPGGVTYSYLPGVFMWMSPWKAIGLDTRYSQLITRLLTSVLLFLIARKASGRRDFMTFVPALLFITFPLTTFFIVRAWNDDISLMCYALAAYGMMTRRPWALFIATNFLFLTKQHAVFFVPLLIWFAWREWRDRWAWLKASWVAGLVIAGYLIADWRNFLGSLYGLTFLKFSNIHTVFLERRDPYSLMNYLHLFTGLKSSWFFLVVLLVMGFFVLRSNWRKPDAASVLRGMGAMCLALFIFAPIAFANYYQFALGLVLIGFAATRVSAQVATTDQPGWEPRTNWWVIGFIASRAAILFNFSWLIVETRKLGEAGEALHSGKMPLADFFFPFSLAPTFFADTLGRLGDLHEFLAFHTLFQLFMLGCDFGIGWFVLKRASKGGRTSKLALLFFVFGPLVIGPLWLTSAALTFALVTWIVVSVVERKTNRSFLPEKFEARREALIVLAVGACAGAIVWGGDILGFDTGFNPVLSPLHALILIVALLPLVPPLKAKRWRFPPFAVALVVALALSTWFIFDFEKFYSDPSNPWLVWRTAAVAAAVLLLGFALRKGRTA